MRILLSAGSSRIGGIPGTTLITNPASTSKMG
jgi:hypothetical protein